jgi:DNA-binding response OmpR family regulator
MRILLAEDDLNISKIARLALEKIGGHQVEWAPDGEVALEKALTGDYDLILLDEMMPHMNGLKVCELYKEQCPHPKPVIFLSAKSQESDINAFKKFGLGHIPKPFDPMTLNQSIQHLMESLAA